MLAKPRDEIRTPRGKEEGISLHAVGGILGLTEPNLKAQAELTGMSWWPEVHLPVKKIPTDVAEVIYTFTLEGRKTNGTHFYIVELDEDKEKVYDDHITVDGISDVEDFPPTKVEISTDRKKKARFSYLRVLDFQKHNKKGYWVISDVAQNGIPVQLTEIVTERVAIGVVGVGAAGAGITKVLGWW